MQTVPLASLGHSGLAMGSVSCLSAREAAVLKVCRADCFAPVCCGSPGNWNAECAFPTILAPEIRPRPEDYTWDFVATLMGGLADAIPRNHFGMYSTLHDSVQVRVVGTGWVFTRRAAGLTHVLSRVAGPVCAGILCVADGNWTKEY